MGGRAMAPAPKCPRGTRGLSNGHAADPGRPGGALIHVLVRPGAAGGLPPSPVPSICNESTPHDGRRERSSQVATRRRRAAAALVAAMLFTTALSSAVDAAPPARAPGQVARAVMRTAAKGPIVVTGILRDQGGRPSAGTVALNVLPNQAENCKLHNGDALLTRTVGWARAGRDGRFALRANAERFDHRNVSARGGISFEVVGWDRRSTGHDVRRRFARGSPGARRRRRDQAAACRSRQPSRRSHWRPGPGGPADVCLDPAEHVRRVGHDRPDMALRVGQGLDEVVHLSLVRRRRGGERLGRRRRLGGEWNNVNRERHLVHVAGVSRVPGVPRGTPLRIVPLGMCRQVHE